MREQSLVVHMTDGNHFTHSTSNAQSKRRRWECTILCCCAS